MIKYVVKTVCFVFLVTTFEIKSIYFSLNGWVKAENQPEEKIVAVIGEKPIFFEAKKNELEHLHSCLNLRELKKISSVQNKKVAILIDGSFNYTFNQIYLALKMLKEYVDLNDRPALGAHVELFKFADSDKGHNALNFFRNDETSKSIILAQQTIETIQRVTQAFKLRNNPLRFDTDENKKEILNNKKYRSHLEKKIFSLCPDVTLNEFFYSFDSIARRNLLCEETSSLLHHFEQFSELFKKHGIIDGTSLQLKDLFWSIFENFDLTYFNGLNDSFIKPMKKLCHTLELRRSTSIVLDNFDFVVVYCNYKNVDDLNNFLENKNFSSNFSNFSASSISLEPCSLVSIERLFDILHKKLQKPCNKPFKPSLCKVCSEMDSADKRHKVCSGCYGVHYCSERCQKADWPGHKKNCINLEKFS